MEPQYKGANPLLNFLYDKLMSNILTYQYGQVVKKSSGNVLTIRIILNGEHPLCKLLT